MPIESPARINKVQLALTGEFRGAVNDSSFAVGGEVYAAGTLEYVTFAGVPVKGSKPAEFAGVHQFRKLDKAADGPGVKVADFSQIPTMPEE